MSESALAIMFASLYNNAARGVSLSSIEKLAVKTKTGMAELLQVTSKNGRPERTTIAVANIENGTVEFRQCEAGLLEIQLPGSQAILIGFALAAPPAANS